MQKVLCIGEALIDMICTDRDRSLSAGENFVKKAGGAPANVAATIAALGGNVDFVTKIGADPFGEFLINTIAAFNINTQWTLKDPGSFTTFAFVSLLENGERDFYFNRGADGLLSEEDIKSLPLQDYGIAHFGSATAFLPGKLQKAYKYLFEQCIAQSLFTSFDPNYRHLLFKNNTESFIEQSWHFLKRCDFFKLSEDEALLLTQQNDLTSAVDYLCKETKAVFTITLGSKGALVRVEDKTATIPAVKAKVVDTTGAGDAFTGMLLYQLSLLSHGAIEHLNQTNWQQIVAQANTIGAKACEYVGAMEAYKYLKT